MAEPRENKAEKTKSGIDSPAGYNGKAPSSLEVPLKIYPGSSKLGHDRGGKGMIEGPLDGKTQK